MNFEESNSFVERMEKNNKNKKTVLTILGICAVLIVVLIAIIGYIRYRESLKLKLYIDDKQVAISPTLFVQQEDTMYMNIRELANLLGYSYQKGEYKKYTEDVNSCYLKSNYEVVSMTAGSENITKYILNENQMSTDKEQENTVNQTQAELISVDNKTKQETVNIKVESENDTPQVFTMGVPVQIINQDLYVAFSELPRMMNVRLDIAEKNKIKIYSFHSMLRSATQIATNLGYSVVSNTYENLTAMVDNMLVVGDGSNFGVVSLENGQEVIGLKYKEIVYMQNDKEFLVRVDGTVGTIAADGTTIIQPTRYDNISKLDEIHKLYLVEKGKKYGVLNGEGEVIVSAEYDGIGIENKEEFEEEEIRNFNLLFDKCIPVTLGDKMGMIDITGEEKLKCTYDAFGYVPNSVANHDSEKEEEPKEIDEDEEEEQTNLVENSKTKNSATTDGQSVLTIPEQIGIQGIVVNIGGLYGIYDAQAERLIIPCVCSKIYARTKSGVTTYYLEYNDEEIELESYLESKNLKSVSSNQQEETEESEEPENQE